MADTPTFLRVDSFSVWGGGGAACRLLSLSRLAKGRLGRYYKDFLPNYFEYRLWRRKTVHVISNNFTVQIVGTVSSVLKTLKLFSASLVMVSI